jgi:hypothetical protein
MQNKLQDATASRPQGFEITRRQLLTAGGAALVGLSMRGDLFAAVLGQDFMNKGVMTITKAKKPVFVAAAGSRDPVAHSLAENLFWLDQEAEHATFYRMLMPSPELDAQRRRAQDFEAKFTSQLQQVKTANLDRGNYANFNRSSTELVKQFLDFKHELEKAQKAGQLKSLIYPTFLDHTAREAERFAKRIDQFSAGKVEYDRGEVVSFWSRIMAEHADFIAHLLDPEERTLIDKALATSAKFRSLRDTDKAEGAADEIIAFKATAGKGIEAGQIKSIIHPALADHVLREALKFADELKRAEGKLTSR